MLKHDAVFIISNICGFDKSLFRMYVKSYSYDCLSAASYSVSDLQLSR